eukprot:1708540-Rhodomonas_salina.1
MCIRDSPLPPPLHSPPPHSPLPLHSPPPPPPPSPLPPLPLPAPPCVRSAGGVWRRGAQGGGTRSRAAVVLPSVSRASLSAVTSPQVPLRTTLLLYLPRAWCYRCIA